MWSRLPWGACIVVVLGASSIACGSETPSFGSTGSGGGGGSGEPAGTGGSGGSVPSCGSPGEACCDNETCAGDLRCAGSVCVAKPADGTGTPCAKNGDCPEGICLPVNQPAGSGNVCTAP